MQRLSQLIIQTMILGCLSFTTYANTKNWVQSQNKIKNIATTISYIKSNSPIPVVFPARIPDHKDPLFAIGSTDTQADSPYWQILITTDAKCITKSCIVGLVSATKNGKQDFTYIQAPLGSNNKPIMKQKVKLDHHLTGYYTPGHAEADWHHPTLEWEDAHVLYTLTWQVKDPAKSILITMANSAL
jgi:hypothetical protein